jgi:hypothetical protein
MIRNWILALLFVASTGGATLTVALPQPAAAACSERLLTFPAWYRGLLNSDCDVMAPTDAKGGLTGFIWTIILNVTEFLIQLVAFVSIGFIITGGFKFMTSAGSPDGMAKARKTVTNAIIGLLISIFAVAIVNLVAGAIK